MLVIHVSIFIIRVIESVYTQTGPQYVLLSTRVGGTTVLTEEIRSLLGCWAHHPSHRILRSTLLKTGKQS